MAFPFACTGLHQRLERFADSNGIKINQLEKYSWPRLAHGSVLFSLLSIISHDAELAKGVGDCVSTL